MACSLHHRLAYLLDHLNRSLTIKKITSQNTNIMEHTNPSIELTDEQWDLVAPLIPAAPPGPGRPRHDDRLVLNAILWVTKTGAPWVVLPDTYPSYQTCHRRLLEWTELGVMDDILDLLYWHLQDRSRIDISVFFERVAVRMAGLGLPNWWIFSEELSRQSWQVNTAFIFLMPALVSIIRPSARGKPRPITRFADSAPDAQPNEQPEA
jgi:transposase